MCFFYVWSQYWFVEDNFVTCFASCISFSSNNVGAADCGLFLLVQVRGYFWSIAPGRKGVNLELSPLSSIKLLDCEIEGSAQWVPGACSESFT